MSFENVFTHGNLVDLNIRMWTAERKLRPEDLGLDDVGIAEVFTLGRKKLIPGEVIKKMRYFDHQARTCLINHSFPFAFGGARFIPKKRFIDFVNEMEKIRAEFNEEADKVAANYAEYKLQVRSDYVKAAEEAYKRVAYFHEGFSKTRDEFINEFLERVDKAYPSAEEIRSKYSLDYVVFQAALPDLTRASYEDIAEEDGKIRLLEDVYKKSLYQKVNGFVDSTLASQRERASRVLSNFCDILSKGRVVRNSTYQVVSKMIEEYEKMDFVGDDEFIGKLHAFKKYTIDRFTAKQVHNSVKLRQSIADQLKLLLDTACDKAVIDALAEAYRKKIGL